MGCAAALTAAALAFAPAQRPARPLVFETAAKVVYAAQPGRAHRLVASYAGAQRARWQIDAAEAGDARLRRVRYRRDDAVLALEPGEERSRELEGEERASELAAIELRRALSAWPDGFAWTGEGERREADLGALGRLVARVGADGMPCELRALDPAGAEREAYRAVRWIEREGRRWPGAAERWAAGELVWREELERASTRVHYLDGFFSPADRRGERAAEVATAQLAEVQASCGRRFELAAGSSWEQAIAELEALHERWGPILARAGHELERKATVELGEGLAPRACVLRLRSVPAGAPPEGFELAPARRVAAVPLGGLERLSARHLDQALAAAPGADRRAAYVRFDLDQAAVGQALLVLPLASPR